MFFTHCFSTAALHCYNTGDICESVRVLLFLKVFFDMMGGMDVRFGFVESPRQQAGAANSE